MKLQLEGYLECPLSLLSLNQTNILKELWLELSHVFKDGWVFKGELTYLIQIVQLGQQLIFVL